MAVADHSMLRRGYKRYQRKSEKGDSMHSTGWLLTLSAVAGWPWPASYRLGLLDPLGGKATRAPQDYCAARIRISLVFSKLRWFSAITDATR